MKPSRLTITFILIFSLLLSGCFATTEEKQEQATEKDMRYNLASIGTNQSNKDRDFVELAKTTIRSAQRLIGELEQGLGEAQGHDELHEVQEMMVQANQDLLYLWNRANNEVEPDHPELKKFKAKLVHVIGEYRLGLSTELEGMEVGNPSQLREGYQLSMKAWHELQQVAEDAQKL
ncbi:hypothetical protein [Ammoniphilus sp. YIM 78166]|uniref:hypothetical protein n=1 Tax=Ammoniphilus sp. YIM 78166 TaxID=1644106 RepID=UPI0010703D11|nr:hypothetical protein [Ammoniphilus sp. YIM 78166]